MVTKSQIDINVPEEKDFALMADSPRPGEKRKSTNLVCNKHDYEKTGLGVISKSCRLAILQLAHDIPLAGHLGTEKTKDRVLQNFNWPGIFSDISQYCKSCPDCQKTARSRFANRAPLIPLPTIDIPFKRICMDILCVVLGHKYSDGFEPFNIEQCIK